MLVSCRTNKFPEEQLQVGSRLAKSPRASRRALSPRAAAEKRARPPLLQQSEQRPQLKATQTPGQGGLPCPLCLGPPQQVQVEGLSPSASSASSFRWQSEVGSKDCASPAPVRLESPVDRRAVDSGACSLPVRLRLSRLTK